ncbi:MAG: hypothetical protein HYY40_03275 [Bacteroidetes bacterium]|nr:hypothetical protein [Bacteroidota bacterium]
MKNLVLLAPWLFITIFLSAQTKPAQTVAEKEKLLCRTWKFTLSEEFGLENEPAAEQKNDSILFKSDKKVIMINSGVLTTGFWSLDKGGNFLYVTPDNSATKIMFGLKSITEDKLVLEFQTPDLVRTRYHYEVKRK